MNKKINYSEGDCFSIPLREGGFARGVVTRMDGHGIIFGYFFGPKIAEFSDIKVGNLHPNDAFFSGQFGDIGLINLEWKIIGKVEEWSRTSWKMPLFLNFNPEASTGFLREYDDNSLLCIKEEEVAISSINPQKYPKDSVMGYGFVEIKLTKLLD